MKNEEIQRESGISERGGSEGHFTDNTRKNTETIPRQLASKQLGRGDGASEEPYRRRRLCLRRGDHPHPTAQQPQQGAEGEAGSPV